MRDDTYHSIGIASVVLLLACGGCGLAGSNEGTGTTIQPQTIPHEVSTLRTPEVLSAASVTTQKTTLEEPESQSPTSEQSDDHNKSADSSLPGDVAQNLTSLDARVRYQALDHWDAKGGPAPLDPVFEAMEDEDPGVRARATAIVEQAWASEEEQEGK